MSKRQRIEELEQQVRRIAAELACHKPRREVTKDADEFYDLVWFVYDPRSMEVDRLMLSHRRRTPIFYKQGPAFDTKAKAEAYLKALEAGR